MDRVPLRWTESTVTLHPMGGSQCRIPAPFVRNGFFMQVVFQERPSQGGGQGQGSNRGGVQETGAHKVRTCVCFKILWCLFGQVPHQDQGSNSFLCHCCVSVLQRAPSLSSSYCLPSFFLQEIQSFSLAGLCFLKKGENKRRLRWTPAGFSTSVLYLLLPACRYVSDAVTGVIIASILFFFPSQKPSLSWWFNSAGLTVEGGV